MKNITKYILAAAAAFSSLTACQEFEDFDKAGSVKLVGLPSNDLNILAASNQVELSGIESIGAASTGVYVPYDKALQAALTCCGLTTDDVTRASMRFTLIDGEMVMEFVLSDGTMCAASMPKRLRSAA